MKLSRFVHRFEKNGLIAWYYSLNHKVIYTDKKENILDPDFWIHDEKEDEVRIKNLKEKFIQPCINVLYLLLTEGCNLGCSYCSFEGGFSKRPKINPMHFSTAKEAINLYVKCLNKIDPKTLKKKSKLINFYGGEPLMNKKVFIQSLEYIDSLKNSHRLPEDLRLTINTNGTLIDEKIALILKKYNLEVGISIAGPKNIHDANRKYLSGRGTFSKTIKALELLKNLGVNVGISCTVSEESVKILPEIFKWFLEKLGITRMGFNPLLESSNFRVKNDSYFQEIANAMIECYKIGRKAGIQEDRMLRKVKAFVGQYFYDRDCSACGRQIVVGPNHKVGICHSFYGSREYFVDLTPKFDPYIHAYWWEWSKRLPINMKKCLECPALGICGGGCPHNAKIRHGSIWEVDDSFCFHSLQTLEWLIWDLYEKSSKK